MKCFGVLLLISVLVIFSGSVHSQERPEAMKIIIDECMTQENLTEEDKLAFRSHNLDNASQNLKCFSKCLMEKHEQMKREHADIMGEMLIQHYGAEKVKEIGAKCMFEEATDKCQTAHMIHKCMNDNNIFI